MYLRGSKWSYTRRRKPVNVFRIMILVVLIAAVVYVNQVVVPTVPPLFVPTPTATRSPESFITEAEDFLKDGKMTQAMQSYESAIHADPKNPSNYINLARLEVYTGQYADAATNASNALLLSPNNSMAAAIRGWALSYITDADGKVSYLDAKSALNQAIKLDPNNASAYAFMAELLANMQTAGQGGLTTVDEASQFSKKALGLGPNLYETHYARGLVLEITQNNEDAIKEYQAAVTANPKIAEAHLAMGRNYRLLQLYDKAIEEFTTANGLNPNDPLPLAYISTTYMTVGEYAKAIQFAKQAIQANPSDPYMYGNLGTMQYRTKDYANAIESLKMAAFGDGDKVKGLPLDYGRITEYYYMLGLAEARQGQCGDALKISQMLQQGVPTDETAVFNAQAMVDICQGNDIQPTTETTPGSGSSENTPPAAETSKTTATKAPATKPSETPAP
jgi:tetratricopeptide (TPR) repeat protein